MSIRKFNLNIFITQTPFPNNCWKHHVVSRHHRSLSHTCKIYARVINQTINTKIGSSLSTKPRLRNVADLAFYFPSSNFDLHTLTRVSAILIDIAIPAIRSPSNTFVSRGFEKKDFEILYVWREMERSLDEIKKKTNFVKFSSKMRISLIRDEEAVHARFTGQDRATYPGYIGRTGTSERSSKRCVTVKR